MALSDIFTGGAYKDAAAQQRAYLDALSGRVGTQIAGTQAGGLAALTSGQGGALGAIGPAFGQARTDISGATPQALDYLGRYTGQGAGALQTGQEGGLAALQ